MEIHECSCSFVFAMFNNLNGTRVRSMRVRVRSSLVQGVCGGMIHGP